MCSLRAILQEPTATSLFIPPPVPSRVPFPSSTFLNVSITLFLVLLVYTRMREADGEVSGAATAEGGEGSVKDEGVDVLCCCVGLSEAGAIWDAEVGVGDEGTGQITRPEDDTRTGRKSLRSSMRK